MTSGKLVIGAEQGFYRRRNLELTCKHYGVKLWETLDQLVEQILRYYTKTDRPKEQKLKGPG